MTRRAGGVGGQPPAERVLGRYLLLQRLGSGGFGEVWRAHDELLSREVAVKAIKGGEGERSAREAQAAARLSHPAIVALYEAASKDGVFYLTSELVVGDTLAELIAADALEDEEIIEIGLALCDALQHAHSRGVIHRDVKPQNILIPHDPADGVPAKLTDFGGARLAGEQALTATGDVLGTLAYMAPEQSEGDPAGPQADLYSLALVLYEALTGENPVRAATPAATVRRIGTRLPPLQRARRDLRRPLAAAVDLALHPDPQRRGSVRALADALAAALPDGPRRAVAVADRPARERPRRSKRALPKLVWTLLALALVVSQLASGRSGLALLLLAGALPLLLALPRRASPAWLAAIAAPALGLIGLASAYPALASQPRAARLRIALGALGFWWLCLAQLAVDRLLTPGVALRGLAGVPAQPSGPLALKPAAAWEGSLTSAAHAIAPLVGLPSLAGAALWALGALLLPLLLRGRSPFVDIAVATAWSIAMLAGPPLLAAALGGHRPGAFASVPAATGSGVAVSGALLGALLAAGLLALRAPSFGQEPYRGSARSASHP